MRFFADLHIHSKYSRATSSDCDLFHLAYWARRKGITVVGTGDFTHPAWMAEIKDKLVPAEPGLFRLKDDLEGAVTAKLEAACRAETRFMLSVEISTIYKKGDKTRKVHHLIYAPDIESAERVTKKLATIGNLGSDGRPILGLDSRHLLEITLEAGEGNYLVPAHVWTPWFSVLGSKAGFDAVEECYGDLAHHVFALETGLSSDPAMNRRLSILDRFCLVSSSDAHSPPKLGREATAFETALDYFAIKKALETKEGFGGTVEFFPEEGKYHLDGHRKCGVRLEPSETKAHDAKCPACGGPITVGVLYRVDELADRPEGKEVLSPSDAFKSFVPLPEVLAEMHGVGPSSKAVEKSYTGLVSRLGPELFILEDAPLEDIARAGSSLLAEGIRRMRAGEVTREAGYDGEYGVIRVFSDADLKGGALIPSAAVPAAKAPPTSPPELPFAAAPPVAPPPKPAPAPEAPVRKGILDGLDEDQRAAAEVTRGPLLILAGPGTGKTRTITHRIAHLVSDHEADPARFLAITFTRKAAGEMRERLIGLLGEAGARIDVSTFHAFGAALLKAYGPEGFSIASERRCEAIRKASRGDEALYKKALHEAKLWDYDDLIDEARAIAEARADVRAAYKARYAHVSIDEYQDIDARQYQLMTLLFPPGEVSSFACVGDPDQAIYGFRGADLGFFLRFREDFTGAQIKKITRSYRSTRTILDAALDVIEKSPTLGERTIRALVADESRIAVHECASPKAEAALIARTIEQMIGGHSFYSIDAGRADGALDKGLGFGDFAVLYRTSMQGEAIGEALRQSGMPFSLRSHDRLVARPLVERLVEVAAAMPELPLEERLKEACARLRGELARPEGSTDEGPTEADADAALALVAPLAARSEGDFVRFTHEVMIASEVDGLDPRADRIALLTLHASKGLEFRVVLIAGCEDGLLPLRFAGREDKTNLDEERRLFYVGMTRAREKLVLSWAKARMRRGEVQATTVSPFVTEIEEALMERSKERKPRGGGSKKGGGQLDLF